MLEETYGLSNPQLKIYLGGTIMLAMVLNVVLVAIIAVAFFFALRSFVRKTKSGGCGCDGDCGDSCGCGCGCGGSKED